MSAIETLHAILDQGYALEVLRVEDRAEGQKPPYRQVYAVHLLQSTERGLLQGHGRDPDLAQSLAAALQQATDRARQAGKT